MPTSRPRSRHAATTAPAGRSSSAAEHEAAAAHLADPGQRAQARREAEPVRSRTLRAARRRARRRPRPPPRTRPGCRRRCWRGRPARSRRRPSSETSRQPIGRPFARPFASVTASGRDAELLPGEERAGPADAALHLVEERAPHRAASASRARGGEELRRRAGCTPPSPCTGSSRMQPVSRADGGVERAVSFSGRERDARQQRLERLALRGLAGDRRARRSCARGTSPRARRRPACRSPCARTSAPPRPPRRPSCRRRRARRRTRAESRCASSTIGSVQ